MVKLVAVLVLFTGCASAPKREWSTYTKREKVDAALYCIDTGDCDPAPGVHFVRRSLN